MSKNKPKKLVDMIIGAIVIFIIFSANIAGAGTELNVKFLEYDINVGYPKYIVNIQTSEDGHLKYLENYYSIDSNGGRKFYSGNIFYDDNMTTKNVTTKNVTTKNMTTNNVTFEIYRPKSRSGMTFSLIEMVVIINNETVLTKWRDLHKIKRWGYIPAPINKTSINKTSINKASINKTRDDNISERNANFSMNMGMKKTLLPDIHINMTNSKKHNNTDNLTNSKMYNKKDNEGFDFISMAISSVVIIIMVLWSMRTKKFKN